ncbi:MAG: Unknown protein [uncultured Thiotrichaceae bacterium]|uniref:Co-chaperone DjlA N-terminal domain-containing protein n=1 Tax=uncultured Thiotrichaceae bacterium TaxID=298394 RepID=A0A6S6T2R8_9GAMM|nr:MAG: Unknown protein [uncultured Thiotrichaceae bacterium]
MRKFILDLVNSFNTNDSDHDSVNIDQATAVLLVEVMAADHEWDDIESNAIKDILITQFSLNSEEAEALLSDSTQSQQKANDLYQFTKVITENFSHDQRYEMLVNLWKVAFADGQVDRYEEHMIRKITDLLHMPHTQYIRAKHQADPTS